MALSPSTAVNTATARRQRLATGWLLHCELAKCCSAIFQDVLQQADALTCDCASQHHFWIERSLCLSAAVVTVHIQFTCNLPRTVDLKVGHTTFPSASRGPQQPSKGPEENGGKFSEPQYRLSGPPKIHCRNRKFRI